MQGGGSKMETPGPLPKWRGGGTTANPLGNLGSERQSYPLLIGSTLRVSTE